MITINLEKFQFKPGEEIKGQIFLNLKKPVKAEELVVGLAGKQRSRKGDDIDGYKVFEFFQRLDGEKIYTSTPEPYNFSIMIPSNIISQVKDNLGRTILNVIGTLTGSFHLVRWYVVVRLKTYGIDITKEVQINIY
ncbi:MAG: hypothetical protein QW117_02305 [Candidatus Pacearchaeota archaeon]